MYLQACRFNNNETIVYMQIKMSMSFQHAGNSTSHTPLTTVSYVENSHTPTPVSIGSCEPARPLAVTLITLPGPLTQGSGHGHALKKSPSGGQNIPENLPPGSKISLKMSLEVKMSLKMSLEVISHPKCPSGVPKSLKKSLQPKFPRVPPSPSEVPEVPPGRSRVPLRRQRSPRSLSRCPSQPSSRRPNGNLSETAVALPMSCANEPCQ